eukprot:13010312-Alexandrium_andersonii.AAC.1
MQGARHARAGAIFLSRLRGSIHDNHQGPCEARGSEAQVQVLSGADFLNKPSAIALKMPAMCLEPCAG